VPLKGTPSGFVMLKDLQPLDPEILVSSDTPASAAPANTSNTQATQSNIAAEEAEPQPPQPFEYVS
jgi:26S proteasome regulatory subunit N2